MTSDALPNLSALLEPVGAEAFFAEYWQRRMLAMRLEPETFEQILRAIGPLDVARFAGLARGGVQAWVANAQIAHTVLSVDAVSAPKALAMGATLYFIDVPLLDEFRHSLAQSLGAPAQKILVSFFLTPPGGGATRHFDANENFTIQLTGAKRWSIGEAPALAAAPDGHVEGLRLPASLAGLLDDASPAAAQAVDMAPGSLLYVPRGTFHRTETREQSWSLNLSYGRAMWLDLVCDGLRDRLMVSPRWRGSVAGIGEKSDAAAANILGDLVVELRDMLNDPEEVEKLCRAFIARGEIG